MAHEAVRVLSGPRSAEVDKEGGRLRDVFVHSSVLLRPGITDLEPGQRVLACAEGVLRWLQPTEVEPF